MSKKNEASFTTPLGHVLYGTKEAVATLPALYEHCKGQYAKVDVLTARVAELENERDAAIRKKEFCEEWYAVRWERLHAYVKEAGQPYFSDICSIMGNGTLTGSRLKRGESPAYDPPTYSQILNSTKHERNLYRDELMRQLAYWEGKRPSPTMDNRNPWTLHPMGQKIQAVLTHQE